MKRRATFIVIGVLVLCALLIAFNFARQAMIASFLANRQAPAVAVSAVAAEAVTWTPGVEAVGTAKAGLGADLASEVSGVVKAILVQPNQRVIAGQLLIQIDDSVQKADMASAEAAIKLAQSEVDRLTALVRRGASPQATLDNAIAQLDTARAAYARAAAIVAQKAITAPFSGMVGVPRVVVGQYLAAGSVMITLQDLDRILVDFTVPEQRAADLKIGQTARFGSTPDHLDFAGKVIGFDPKVDPQTRLVPAQALLDAPLGRILPGQFLRILLELPAEEGVVTVPETAVVPSLYGDYVFVVTEEPPPEGAEENAEKRLVARQAFVKAGRRNNTTIEIAEGLKAGDMVVVSGQNRIQAGALVTIADNVVPGAPTGRGDAP